MLTQISAQLRKEYGVSLRFHELIEEYSSIETLAEFMLEKVEEQTAEQFAGPETAAEPDEEIVAETPGPSAPALASTASSTDRLEQLVEKQTEMVMKLVETVHLLAAGTALDGVAAQQPVTDTEDDREIRWSKDMPPVRGAKLGRDPQGNPGWYLADKQGGYKKVEFH